ncbi:MAG: hypothetical protein HY764_00635 [Candidatus Portnoybacteria bacterium]|nr:hypothetical protein [Candidatus Portnoybacteria bacterium]
MKKVLLLGPFLLMPVFFVPTLAVAQDAGGDGVKIFNFFSFDPSGSNEYEKKVAEVEKEISDWLSNNKATVLSASVATVQADKAFRDEGINTTIVIIYKKR